MHAGAARSLVAATAFALSLSCGWLGGSSRSEKGTQQGSGQGSGSGGTGQGAAQPSGQASGPEAASAAGQGGGPAARPPAPVTVAEVTPRDVPETLSAVGTVQPSTTVSVRPLVSGTVVAVYFDDGAEVEKGQKLFQIDPRSYRQALAQAKANLAHTQEQAANAHADVRRYKPLLKGGYVTPQQYDTAVATARSLDADVDGLTAAVKQAQLDLSNCLITAPIRGRTGAILVQQGNVVQANQTSPLVVISALRPAYVAFSAPEQYVSQLRQGLGHMPVVVQAAGIRRQGVLTFLNNAVDTAAGTILARGTFANEGEVLWPGAFVDVKVVLGVRKGALTVPRAAIVSSQAGQAVYVVRADQTVKLQPVQVVQTTEDLAVIGKGLSAGGEVVTDGQLGLAPGARVAVQGQPKGGQAQATPGAAVAEGTGGGAGPAAASGPGAAAAGSGTAADPPAPRRRAPARTP